MNFPSFFTSSPESDEPQPSGWASFIGIVICICGNVIISFALNIQRLAHERIQSRRVKLPRTTSETRRQSQASDQTRHYGTITPKNNEEEEEEDGGTEYLKSKLWWTGLILMIIGEAGNFVAYGFAPASIVAPLGTVAILCNALIAPLVFKEKFRIRDFIGVVLSTVGAVTIVLSAKNEEEKLSPEDIWAAITETPFLIYFSICCGVAVILMYLSQQVGERSILIDLGLVAIFGGFTALSTKGISSILSLSLYRIFTFPIAYLLLFVLVSTAILQVKYLNKALARFSSMQVIPTQFVMFTISVVLGSAILYKDFNAATTPRIAKFTIGCLLTFIGVELITKRHSQRSRPQHKPSLAPLIRRQPIHIIPSPATETLQETPPHLLGTSFGYHFANPRSAELRSSTMPRAKRSLDFGTWARWRQVESDMTRSLSEQGQVEHEENGDTGRDWASEAAIEERRTGASVV